MRLLTTKERERKKVFKVVEALLIQYIQLRKQLCMIQDGLGLSYLVVKDRTMKIAKSVLPPDVLSTFKCSAGFIYNCFKRSGLRGVKLQGEGGEVDEQKAESEMAKFRVELGELMEKHNITPERVFNAD